jgi:hypothetical protein
MRRGVLIALLAFTSIAATPLTSSKCGAQTRCCKICTKGKACGNSCIARDRTCHKGKGCACDSR